MDVFGDTKEVIKNRKSKDRQYNNQNKMDKMTMTYKALQTKLKIEQHEPHKKPE